VAEFAAVVIVGGAGLVLGFLVGARYAFNLLMSGRAIRTAGARMAVLMPPSVPERTTEDILAGRVRIVLGTIQFALPVLPRAASRRWLEQMDARYAVLVNKLIKADGNIADIVTEIAAEQDTLYELLLSYDQTHVLPPREEIDEYATDAQVLHAVLEVWRAVNPLVASVANENRTPTASPEPQTS
jgi:hypothetical protein